MSGQLNFTTGSYKLHIEVSGSFRIARGSLVVTGNFLSMDLSKTEELDSLLLRVTGSGSIILPHGMGETSIRHTMTYMAGKVWMECKGEGHFLGQDASLVLGAVMQRIGVSHDAKVYIMATLPQGLDFKKVEQFKVIPGIDQLPILNKASSVGWGNFQGSIENMSEEFLPSELKQNKQMLKDVMAWANDMKPTASLRSDYHEAMAVAESQYNKVKNSTSKGLVDGSMPLRRLASVAKSAIAAKLKDAELTMSNLLSISKRSKIHALLNTKKEALDLLSSLKLNVATQVAKHARDQIDSIAKTDGNMADSPNLTRSLVVAKDAIDRAQQALVAAFKSSGLISQTKQMKYEAAWISMKMGSLRASEWDDKLSRFRDRAKNMTRGIVIPEGTAATILKGSALATPLGGNMMNVIVAGQFSLNQKAFHLKVEVNQQSLDRILESGLTDAGASTQLLDMSMDFQGNNTAGTFSCGLQFGVKVTVDKLPSGKPIIIRGVGEYVKNKRFWVTGAASFQLNNKAASIQFAMQKILFLEMAVETQMAVVVSMPHGLDLNEIPQIGNLSATYKKQLPLLTNSEIRVSNFVGGILMQVPDFELNEDQTKLSKHHTERVNVRKTTTDALELHSKFTVEPQSSLATFVKGPINGAVDGELSFKTGAFKFTAKAKGNLSVKAGELELQGHDITVRLQNNKQGLTVAVVANGKIVMPMNAGSANVELAASFDAEAAIIKATGTGRLFNQDATVIIGAVQPMGSAVNSTKVYAIMSLPEGLNLATFPALQNVCGVRELPVLADGSSIAWSNFDGVTSDTQSNGYITRVPTSPDDVRLFKGLSIPKNTYAKFPLTSTVGITFGGSNNITIQGLIDTKKGLYRLNVTMNDVDGGESLTGAGLGSMGEVEIKQTSLEFLRSASKCRIEIDATAMVITHNAHLLLLYNSFIYPLQATINKLPGGKKATIQLKGRYQIREAVWLTGAVDMIFGNTPVVIKLGIRKSLDLDANRKVVPAIFDAIVCT